MTDVESTFRAELNRMLAVDATPDWEGVLASAREAGGGARGRRLGIAVAVLLATAAVALVTPLGGAIARGLDEFATWLTGEPGTPVSEEEQRAFEQENRGRTWRGFEFPRGTQLRRLITRRVGDSTIELLGFRSGHSLCLRLVVSGALKERATECAPLAELRRQGGAVRVLVADEHVGRGDKEAWYGLDRYLSAKLLVTAGIAADGVEAVVLRDDAGRHEVPVESNAFVYVAEEPEVGQRVREVWARTAAGLVAVPLSAPLWTVFGPAGTPRSAPPPAPPVEREVSGGRIGWLEAREERGEPLDVIPPQVLNPPPLQRFPVQSLLGPHVVFGRVVEAPDPARSFRLALALSADRPGGEVKYLCTVRFEGNAASGGCVLYPDLFERAPFHDGGGRYGAGAFNTMTGIASDDVARLEILLADGTRIDVPLADNAFIVDVPRAGLPGRVVAYDSGGRVISSSQTVTEPSLCCVSSGPGEPAPGKPELLWRAEGPNGSHSELSVGPSTLGDECMFIKTYVDDRKRAPSIQCHWQSFARSPVQVNNGWRGRRRFVNGRVRDDVKSVRIRFADGETVVVKPRRGYVLYALPADRFTGMQARRAVGADGLDASGRVVATVSFPRPRGG
jgi:hypothetical protein